MSHRDGSYSRSRSRSPTDDERVYRPRTKEPDSAPKVFVGNLAYDTQEEDFRAHFEQCGKIVEVLMPRDPATNRSKGYGFVTFEDFESMDKAMRKLHGSTLLGNELKVDRANERKERPKLDDRRGGGYNSTYDKTRSSYDRGGYDHRDRGSSGYDHRDRGGGGDYDRDRGGSYRSSGHDAGPVKKPVGYRCRISGLARDVGWQLLKDFLRQVGDVTYANVDPDGMGVGEYQTYAECRDACDKLTGAALDGHIVKLTALNFDYETGERLDRQGTRAFDMSSSKSNPFDFSSRDRGGRSNTTGGGNAGNNGFVQRHDNGHHRSGGSGGGYSNGRADNGGSYSDRRDDRGGGRSGGVVYSNAHNAAGGGGSSRYGGGSGGWTGGSSRYGGSGGDDGYRGGGGPDRGHSKYGDRHGPYDRPSGSR